MKRKKKKSRKIIKKFVLLIFIILIGLYFYYLIFNQKIFEYKSKITIEVGEAIPTIKDYLYNEEKIEEEIKWKDIDSKDGKVYKPGTYIGAFTHKDEEIEVTLIVKDTTPPVIKGIKNIEMLAYNEKANMLENISASDNSGEIVKVTVEGKYNTEKPGEYTLYYTAKDSSGNIAKEKFVLTVKENKNVKISKTSKGNTIKNYYGITYIDDVIVVNKTYNLPSTFAPNNLSTLNGYIKVVDYVKDAFNKLKSDATSLGLNIYASSGYRSYSNQEYIYNRYVKADGQEKADTYSARAGHSEHQTGLAIDLNTIDSSFENTSESNWLKENCHNYGFIIRYPKGKSDITGYKYEPWHIRYVGVDLATKLYNNGNWITMEEYYGIDSKYK